MSTKSKIYLVVLILMFGAILWYGDLGALFRDGGPETATTGPAWDKSEAKQAERKAFMDKLIASGYVSEITRNGNAMPRVWVRPSFTSGDLKDKQNILSVIYGYYFDGTQPLDSLAIIDARTGKEIGRYSLEHGLR